MSASYTPNNKQLPPSAAQTDGGSLSRLSRQLSQSAKGYFSKKDKDAPTSSSSSSAPGTPAVGDVIGEPTPLQRFLSLGQPRKDSDLEFPPAHWSAPEQGGHAGTATQPPIVFADEPASPELLADPAVTSSALTSSADPPPEPVTLAQRIQALLSRSAATPSADNSADDEHNTTDSTPASHPPPALVTDPKLVTLLSSPAVMNGTFSKTGQSVWAVLDKLRAQLPGQTPSNVPEGARSGISAAEERTLEDDDSGVMIYGPLIPNDGSQVELARSEEVADTDDEKTEERPAAKPDTLGLFKSKVEEVWPFKAKKEGKQSEAEAASSPSTSRVHFQPVQPGKTKRVWIPSPDKISIQVMWWGYRIYLPPPVLDILDDKHIEGTKRAAMLTAALKWALDRVPLAMIPLQARPAMMLLKAFTPYLGYVGGFVAWSWSAVKSFDKGYGVTLTATWLLTVAVIPGTWEEKDFPKDVTIAVPQRQERDELSKA